ncbi:MAG: preQ(1) synthase [Candidatus Aureabacteria bacterium]|nr:preQ(1) synthase [Candidatus Auribacterota bacterium]
MAAVIDTFKNNHPGRDYKILIVQPEFTSLCPVSGNPDFAKLTIEYIPDKLCLELKSLKFYLNSFRNKGIFYENLINEIMETLKDSCSPRWMKVTGEFTPRGGLSTTVTVEHHKRARAG